MKERPVLFSTAMVLALLAGRKTMTRRNRKLGDVGDILTFTDKIAFESFYSENWGDDDFETWDNELKEYDNTFINEIWKAWLKKEPKLLLTAVYQEHLQDISDVDCIKEGIFKTGEDVIRGNPVFSFAEDSKIIFETKKHAFVSIWDSIYGNKIGKSWNENPLVWVHEFEVIK